MHDVKLESHRAHFQHSTGPRTPEGVDSYRLRWREAEAGDRGLYYSGTEKPRHLDSVGISSPN